MQGRMKVTLVRPTTFINSVSHPLNLSYVYSSLATEPYVDLDYVDGERFGLKYFRKRNAVNVTAGHPMWRELAAAILHTRADMIGFSCYSLSMTGTKFVIDILRQEGFKGQIWAGGIHPTTDPNGTLTNIPGLNGVVISEAEITIKELCGALYRHEPLRNVAGIAYKENGAIVRTPGRPFIEDLDTLPIPTRTFGTGQNLFGEHLMLTSRGCPFACDFCDSKNVWTRRVRYRSGKHVAREIRSIANLGVRYVGLRDDIFGMHIDHVAGVAKAIRDAGLDAVSYTVGSRIDTMRGDMLSLLKSMNVDQITFGVETGSPSVQKRIIKEVDAAEVVPTVERTNKAGIRTITFFMLGHPGETEQEINETFQMIRDLSRHCNRRNAISINIVCPYPVTGYWTYAVAKRGQFVDFFKDSHRYYHQALPFVNITEMEDEVFHDYIMRIRKYANSVNLRYKMYSVLERPWLLGQRAKILGRKVVLKHA